MNNISLNKIVTLAFLGKNLYRQWLLKRAMSDIATIIALTVITAILLSAVLAGGFSAGYILLRHYGVDTQNALIYVGTAVIVTTLAFIAATYIAIRNLLRMQQQLVKAPLLASQATEVVNAFLDGIAGINRS